ncbi:MAG: preprotein translocase subunit SecE [Gammaproteobacteria bacterium RIFCSPHIGHO2_12_FULL_42_13]|nr:MAG: preprotein translocase subunit SecE [Gammaproteobacteria bacterium RIFCSPHIGHO2_12_FULL_42_13]
MVVKVENQGEARFDKVKWLLAFALLLAGLVANHYYSQVSMLLRTLVWLIVLAVASFVASKTQKGKWVLEFFRDSRMELRKVIWPTREETTQTTLVVAVMVVILALMLWGIDGILVWLIGWLTGQRS